MRLDTEGGGLRDDTPLALRAALHRFGISLSKGRKRVSIQVMRMHWGREREGEKGREGERGGEREREWRERKRERGREREI